MLSVEVLIKEFEIYRYDKIGRVTGYYYVLCGSKMAQQQTRDVKQFPVFKLDGRRNKMKFLLGFRRVAEHYHTTELVYDNLTRPADWDNLEERTAVWDESNRLAVETLTVYIPTRVRDVVGMGEEITAGEYYQCHQAMFLHTGAESLAMLQMRLANCQYQQGEEIFSWLAYSDNKFLAVQSSRVRVG